MNEIIYLNVHHNAGISMEEKNNSGIQNSPLEPVPNSFREPGGIVITGAAGFIASCMVQYLNEHGFKNLILADKFIHDEKEKNWKKKNYQYLVDREMLFEWLNENKTKLDFVIHLGARTDTTEFDTTILKALNVEYSQDVWNYCTVNNIPLIYASSAATYGAGEVGYDDDHEFIKDLRPLNPYGISKNEFDKWALQQINHPPFWAGLKFFNVYGPNEYHKGRMASVIFHSFNQIKKDGIVKLFKSHREDFKDGEQLRDFIYVKDVVKVIYWMMKEVGGRQFTVASWQSQGSGQLSVVSSDQSEKQEMPNEKLSSGIYNLGTGKARTFIDLVNTTFAALNMQPKIVFIDMPEDIRNKYQYYTEAAMYKLHKAGYTDPFYSLEEGVNDYVRNYLSAGKIW
ncbi:MAG: NAD-dependent epimerase/dehydratase family protein [Parafilimonas sp.]